MLVDSSRIARIGLAPNGLDKRLIAQRSVIADAEEFVFGSVEVSRIHEEVGRCGGHSQIDFVILVTLVGVEERNLHVERMTEKRMMGRDHRPKSRVRPCSPDAELHWPWRPP